MIGLFDTKGPVTGRLRTTALQTPSLASPVFLVCVVLGFRSIYILSILVTPGSIHVSESSSSHSVQRAVC